MDTISDRIRELRGETSRGQLSKLTGIPKTSLQAMEERDPESSRHLPALAKFWGVSLSWLQTGKGPKAANVPETAPGDAVRQQLIVPINKNTISPSRILRLDPAMIRDGFIVVGNLFAARGGEFKVDVDPDLLARGYEWAQSQNSTLLDSIDADIEARLSARGVDSDGRSKGEVGAKAAGRRSR